MRTDPASTFPPLASHLPAERPRAAAPPVGAQDDLAEPPVFDFARDAALFVRVLRAAPGGAWCTTIFCVSIVVTAANMYFQVLLNEWNGAFFDAIGRKDLSVFVNQLWAFAAIIAALLALTVAQTFLQERLKFRVREWITRHLLAEWLKPMRVYQLGFAKDRSQNPDQRIQEDTRLLGD